MTKFLRVSIMIAALVLAGLACAFPRSDDGAAPEPTSAPTSGPPQTAPNPNPDTPALEPASSDPQTFTANGTKIDLGSDGQTACSLSQPVTLVVQGDGTAELRTTGVNVIDHTNCTTGDAAETWYINGTANFTTQVVTFETCNFGRFTAIGWMDFSGGKLEGQVSCTNKDNIKFISIEVDR